MASKTKDCNSGADSWVVTVNSLDRIAGTSSGYTVALPVDLPKRAYKCTTRFIAASLTVTLAYAMLIKSPALTRCVSTTTALCCFNGQQQAEPGILYFSTAPERIDVTFMIV
ncbi:hypothetical protein JKP88DRAFT_286519 [Tribonema minus]|uniref:Uncharacterized protein n=1 Tax=Tribonema minus TaxID=303371 RepID=A0A836CLN9_9STRA|nr:hypothetical protein JKP88DRAFT_286519 [Tribonema minus]